ncbi:MAG: hypothetical protein QNK27_02635, partial [Desulfuromusa sp.]|nr:hypothetical protein [Desulfuromusa sp.]
ITTAAPQQPADLESVLNGPLADKLALMKRALAKCIGPVAGKVLKNAVKAWLEQGEPSQTRLGELAEIMRLEIDNEASQNEFLDELKKII